MSRAIPPNHPLRRATDWQGDPWATPEERRAWDQARRRRFLATITPRDWARIAKLSEQVRPGHTPAAIEDLDTPLRVGVCAVEDATRFTGVRIATRGDIAVLVWGAEGLQRADLKRAR